MSATNKLHLGAALQPFHSPFPALLLALVLRLIFFSGFVFSDDAHYAWLAHEGLEAYAGYPILPLRVAHLAVLKASFALFGSTTFALAIGPLLLSLLNVFAAWRLAQLCFNSRRAASWAAFLCALIPTDVMLSTTAFSDTGAAALLGLGIWLLFEAEHGKTMLRLPGSLLLAASLFFKMIAIWLLPLLALLQLFSLRRSTVFPWFSGWNKSLLWAATAIVVALSLEAGIYGVTQGQVLHRFQMQQLNAELCPDDFFKAGSAKGYAQEANRGKALLHLLSWRNPKSIFLRRYTLFVPAMALLAALYWLRRKRHAALVVWFMGLLGFFWAGSSSLQSYQPLPLDLPWYVLPLFLPAAVLAASLLAKLSRPASVLVLMSLTVLSVDSCIRFRDYFAVSELGELQELLSQNTQATVYSDGFTRYGLAFYEHYVSDSCLKTWPAHNPAFRPADGTLYLHHRGNISEWRSMGYTLTVPDTTRDWQNIWQGAGMSLFQFTDTNAGSKKSND